MNAIVPYEPLPPDAPLTDEAEVVRDLAQLTLRPGTTVKDEPPSTSVGRLACAYLAKRSETEKLYDKLEQIERQLESEKAALRLLQTVNRLTTRTIDAANNEITSLGLSAASMREGCMLALECKLLGKQRRKKIQALLDAVDNPNMNYEDSNTVG